MSKHDRNQQGFGLVEALLIFLILSLIGCGGYYVYHSQHTPPLSRSSSATTTTNTSPITSTAYTTTFSKVPADLQSAIIAQFQKSVPACLNTQNLIIDAQGNPSDVRVDYDTAGFAAAGLGCDGGSWAIYAKVNGSWQYLGSTQLAFDCSLLQAYHYPKQLLALNDPQTECFDSNNRLVPYNN